MAISHRQLHCLSVSSTRIFPPSSTMATRAFGLPTMALESPPSRMASHTSSTKPIAVWSTTVMSTRFSALAKASYSLARESTSTTSCHRASASPCWKASMPETSPKTTRETSGWRRKTKASYASRETSITPSRSTSSISTLPTATSWSMMPPSAWRIASTAFGLSPTAAVSSDTMRKRSDLSASTMRCTGTSTVSFPWWKTMRDAYGSPATRLSSASRSMTEGRHNIPPIRARTAWATWSSKPTLASSMAKTSISALGAT